MPGVTRDLISAEVDEDYMLLDTGGLGMELEMTPKQISHAAEDQVDFAILAADVIVLLVDVRSGSPPSMKWWQKNCAATANQSFLSPTRWIAKPKSLYRMISLARSRIPF